MSAKSVAQETASPAAAQGQRGGRKKLWLLLAALAVVAAVGGGGTLYFLKSRPAPQALQNLAQALAWLDDHHDAEARRAAQALQDQGYQDTEFPGGLAYVQGIVAFREASGHDDLGRDRRYMQAAAFLREAERLTLSDERRPEWAMAFGVSLARTGQTDEALPYLEEAFRTHEPSRHEVGLLLTQVYMDGRTRRSLEEALNVNTELVEDAQLEQPDRDQAWMQRAQILLSLERRAEAEQALAHVSHEGSRHQGSTILRARSAMAEKRYREAIGLLEPLAQENGLERDFPAQAGYLMGLCAEQLGEFENAVTFFSRTAERFPESHEAAAAWLGEATALRKLGRNEQALEVYVKVLRTVQRPGGFRNRWVSLKRLQELVIDAWNDWCEHHEYTEAVALAEMMSPAVPREQALELAARAHERWARRLESEAVKLPIEERVARRADVEFRWRQSGQAWARLSDARQSSAAFLQAAWTAAEHLVLGRDFEAAIRKLDLFTENRSSKLISAALVKRGECRMHLGRYDLALHDFETVIRDNPTDPAAFQARYLVGQTHLERNDLEAAERAWRTLLESPELSPTALEWRRALYSLSRALFDTAELARRQASQAALDPNEPPPEHLALAHSRYSEAISRLEEYRDRYPSAEEIDEVRFLLSRSLQRSAEFPRAQWRAAANEAARSEARLRTLELLDRALHEFLQLQANLLARQSAGTLDRTGQAMLRNCYFEVANSYFLKEQYEESIVAYTASAGRYQQEPEALTAYVQIANCYDRLNRKTDALSTLAQAQLILKQLPETAFPVGTSAMSRDDWQRWLDWAMKLHN